MIRLILPLLSTFALGAMWQSDLRAALENARQKKSLILVDFYAPWCYSCYYMDQNVLSQPRMRQAGANLELVKLDVDSGEGLAKKKELNVSFLPTYVVLNEQGKEVGRIVGEQMPGDFFKQLSDIQAKNSTLEELERRLAAKADVETARDALELHVKRGSYKEGLKLLESLPASVKAGVEKDAAAKLSMHRLKLADSRARNAAEDCLAESRGLLTEATCDFPYDAMHVNACIESLPLAKRLPVYEQQERLNDRLIAQRVLVGPERRCADMRSPLELAMDVSTFTGKTERSSQALAKAVDLMNQELAGDFKRDRNKADNLRAFLDMAGRDKDLEALYPKLIEAYPDDYVYRGRFAKFLLAKGRAQEALAQYDLALAKAYGANRYSVIQGRAKALSALGRKQEALDALDAAAQDNPASFPDQVAALSKLKAELQAKK